jgi:uncharacterized membrane protein YkvA (DUF1232 family)
MKFLRDIAHNLRLHGHTIWLCARDPDSGFVPRMLAMLIAAYALSPVDLIPDFIPVLGLLDEALLLPLAIWLLRRMIPPDVYARNLALAEVASQRPVSRSGAALVLAIWGLAALLIWWLLA